MYNNLLENYEYKAGIYIRLSQEDRDKKYESESESVINQRNILMSYIKNNGFAFVEEYVDDGYSGTNFDRPAFQKMIKDITIGQYFPGNSVIHRLDSRVKLVLDILYLVILFTAQSYTGLLLGLLFMVICYMLARIKLIMILKSVKPILPLMIFTGVLNLFFIKGETPLFQWQFISIYPEGVDTALFMLIRVLTLIIGMSLLTYTTSPIMLTDAIERLLSPLKKIHVPVHELSMMMTIALRFIPTLVEETDKIMSAQKARGAEMDTGGLIKKAKSLIPVLIPLFVSAFKRANELATAMECRCYHGGEGRTRLKVMHTAPRDYVAIAIMLALFAGVIVINCFPVLP